MVVKSGLTGLTGPYICSRKLIVIESDKTYLAPNNQGVEVAPLTTILAIPDNAAGPAGNQVGDVLAQLNPWMASCPGAFANISV